MEEFERVKKVD